MKEPIFPPDKQTIVVLIGPPSSYKTSCAKYLARKAKELKGLNVEVISSDMERTQEERMNRDWNPAFMRMFRRACSSLYNGNYVVLDMLNAHTSTRRWRFAAWKKEFQNYAHYPLNVIAMPMDCTLESCISVERKRIDRFSESHMRSVIRIIRSIFEENGYGTMSWCLDLVYERDTLRLWDRILVANPVITGYDYEYKFVDIEI